MAIEPLIQTSFLILRCLILEDTSKVYSMSQEQGMKTWIPDQVYQNEQEAREVLQFLVSKYADPQAPFESPYVLGIILKNSHELIGHVGLSPARNQVEIGYAIETKYQGNGFATEAVTAISDWGITQFKLPLILGIVAQDNIYSCKVLNKSGFSLIDESMGSHQGKFRMIRTYQKTKQ